jgi:hypothetical protein
VQPVTGTLQPLLQFAVAHGANAFEAYPEDLLIAFDPTYPGYSAYHTAYAAAIAAARK